MSNSLVPKRKQARFLLTQALYQWEISGMPTADILLAFQLKPNFQKADQAYFIEAFEHVTKQASVLDEVYKDHLDRPLADLDPVEKSILRLAVFEFMERMDIPYRVIINEALELAKTFGATGSHKYINGVLDKVAKTVRHVEMPSS